MKVEDGQLNVQGQRRTGWEEGPAQNGGVDQRKGDRWYLSVTHCCVTNHPETQRLQATPTHYFSEMWRSAGRFCRWNLRLWSVGETV